jgi:hypothetical protein
MLIIRAKADAKGPAIDFGTPSMDIDNGKEIVRLISSTNKEATRHDVAYCKSRIAKKFEKTVVTVSLVDTDDYNNLVSYTYQT